jgi:hypothetical protein
MYSNSTVIEAAQYDELDKLCISCPTAMGFVCRRDMFSYRARHRINRRNKEFTARNDKPIAEDQFEDDKDDCHNQQSTARKDKPIAEDEFEDD